MGRSRKPLYGQLYRGFESLSFRLRLPKLQRRQASQLMHQSSFRAGFGGRSPLYLRLCVFDKKSFFKLQRRWTSHLFDITFNLGWASADAVRFILNKIPFKNVFSPLESKMISLRLSTCIMYISSNVVTSHLILVSLKILKKDLNDISTVVSLQLSIDCHLN